MIRIFHLSTPRCRIAPLGRSDAVDIADRFGIPAEETEAMLSGPGERRLLDVGDARGPGRLHALILVVRAGGALALDLRIASEGPSASFATEALDGVMRALATAHPFDRLEARCAADDPGLGHLLAAQGFESAAGAASMMFHRTSPAGARIDVC